LGLGRNTDEILILLVPPLSSHNKLLLPSGMLQSMHEMATQSIKRDQWMEALKLYQSVSRICSTFGTTHYLAVIGLALKLAFRDAVLCELASERMKGYAAKAKIEALTKVETELSDSLQLAPAHLFHELSFLFKEIQGGCPGLLKYSDVEDQKGIDSNDGDAEYTMLDRVKRLGALLDWNSCHIAAASHFCALGKTPKTTDRRWSKARKTDILGRTSFHYAGEFNINAWRALF
jgi:hypothetical protein